MKKNEVFSVLYKYQRKMNLAKAIEMKPVKIKKYKHVKEKV
jgi:hypothetical protein